MLSERQEHLLMWLWECYGLFDSEVEEIGQPGDPELLDDLAKRGLVRRDRGAWFPGVVS